MQAPPIRLIISDRDLARSRLTVFFRVLLFVPHLVWLVLWGVVILFTAFINWFPTLFGGRSPDALHNFTARYVRYAVHAFAFLLLAANPFPGFTGKPGSYPVDIEIDPPEHQYRWSTCFRIVLFTPALSINGAVGTSLVSLSTLSYSISTALVGAVLGWWSALIRGRMPEGLRNLIVYGLGYGAQAHGFVLLLTDRFPNSDPRSLPAVAETPQHPVAVLVSDDTRRWQVHVFFRLFLAIPHLLWIYLWGGVIYLLVPIHWFVVLIRGRSVDFFHDFFSHWLRYSTHLTAYLMILADPYPGFFGRPGSYPVDLVTPPLLAQNRWRTLFRVVLAIPALLVVAALSNVMYLVALFGWVVALFTARTPVGLRNLGIFAVRYVAQTSAYALYLLTDAYPYAGPAADPEPAPAAPPRDWPRGEPVRPAPGDPAASPVTPGDNA